jgi:tetratricopeptide (TPR) repeat protein
MTTSHPRLMTTGALIGATVVIVLAAAPQRRPDQMMGDELFAAYLAKDEGVLTGAFPTNVRFEAFRADFRTRVLKGWEVGDRKPIQAMFMLDVAIAALNRGNYLYWLDFIALGGTFLRGRADPPGLNPDYDAFEIAWYKTAVAVLQGRRRPDLAEEQGVRPLRNRVAAAPQAQTSPDAPPMLIDPWIELARGFTEEGFTIDATATLAARGPAALAHYAEAAKYAATRPEATLRSAWLLIRLKRPAEALELLEHYDDRWTDDGVFLYWRRLFRGKALQALGRPEDAGRAYQSALTIVPSAQSPRVGLMALALTQNAHDDAEAFAKAVRTAPDPVIDPWWYYAHGDLRFFPSRLKALREMSRR